MERGKIMNISPYDFMDREHVPPSSNRGAQNTSQSGLIAVVDWLSITFKTEKNITEIISLMDLENAYFLETNGQYGYKKGLVNNGIFLFYEGSPDMGIHLQLTGSGCRYLEQIIDGFNWYNFFQRLSNFDINVTRLDIALDDFKKILSIPVLRKKIKNGECISRFKKARLMETVELNDGSTGGQTIYFGSPTSQIQIRFYEKNHEMKNKGIDHDHEYWNRYEIQLRKERAEKLFYMIGDKNNDDFVSEVKGILNNYIRFVNRKNTKNKSRWPVYKAWKKFINDVDKIKLTISEAEKDIFDSYEWIKKQTAPTLAMLVEAGLTDISEIIDNGKTRLKDTHIKKINDFKQNK